MTVKLLDSPAETGVDVAELIRDNPGAIGEVKHDTLRDLMESGHPIERITPREGASIGRRRRVV